MSTLLCPTRLMLKERKALARVRNDFFFLYIYSPSYKSVAILGLCQKEQSWSWGRNFTFFLLTNLSLGCPVYPGSPHFLNWLDKSWTFMYGKYGQTRRFSLDNDAWLGSTWLSQYFLCVPIYYLWGKSYQRLPGNGLSPGEEWLTARDAMQALYNAETSFKLSVWKAGMGRYRVK